MLACAFSLSACVSPQTRFPRPLEQTVVQEQRRLQDQAITTQLGRLARLHRLAWPIMTRNADLCASQIEGAYGFFMSDPKVLSQIIPSLTPSQIMEAGIRHTPHIGFVTPGTPAQALEMQAGDVFISIAGQAVEARHSARDINAMLLAASRIGAVPVRLRGAEGDVRVGTLLAKRRCRYALALHYGDALNAYTDGRQLTFLTGLMRGLEDDRLIQFIIAHELAHAVLRHPQRSTRATLLSGSGALGAIASSAGWLLDQGAALVGVKPKIPLRARGAALATPASADLEREADYVGLYLLARAGIDLGALEQLFEKFAIERPINTQIELTHPISPERLLLLRQTRMEIEQKRAQGLPLLPEGWPIAQ